MTDLDDLKPHIADQDRPGDLAIAALADRQHGVVVHWQLVARGYTRHQIHGRVRAGRLHPLHRAVYAVGYRSVTRKSRWMAAVLACGKNAVLSHRAATALWDLRPVPSGPIDVTVPGRGKTGQRGIRVHNVRQLHPDDRAVVDGIPATSVHRTLLDYAEVARPQQLRLAIEASDRLELFDLRAVDAMLARSRGRRGQAVLKAVLDEMRGPTPWTRSELENIFLPLIREAGLPEPQVNVIVCGDLVDFWWPEQRLVVEVDGYLWHKTRRSFEDDRRRDVKRQLAGIRTARFTDLRVRFERREVQSEMTCLLSAGPGALASDR